LLQKQLLFNKIINIKPLTVRSIQKWISFALLILWSKEVIIITD